LLGGLCTHDRPDVIAGMSSADDAGIVRITDDLALLLTVDFFAPVLDDPYDFGRATAANALSDIYACGGEPRWALSIAAFPQGLFPEETFQRVMQGGIDLMWQEGCAVVGGHTIDDQEMKFGFSVTGAVHPNKVVTKGGAFPGDLIFVTKPLGSGIYSTALKAGKLGQEEIDDLTTLMVTTNRKACAAMLAAGVHAATDITGFSLMGHGHELALASGGILELSASALNFLPRVKGYYDGGFAPGGLYRNRRFVQPFLIDSENWEDWQLDLACDPQTSGGLLVAIPPANETAFLDAMAECPLQVSHLGTFRQGKPGYIKLIK
jgi:selenide, water dikinase